MTRAPTLLGAVKSIVAFIEQPLATAAAGTPFVAWWRPGGPWRSGTRRTTLASAAS